MTHTSYVCKTSKNHFELAAISQELLKLFRRSVVSSENLPKYEGLNLPWQLQAAGETCVLPSAQGIKSTKHGIPQ